MKIVRLVLIAGVAMALAGCGGDSSKVENVINEQLAKSANCTEVPVGLKVDVSKVGPDGALGILKAKGYIVEAQGSSKDFFGRTNTFDTFALTDKGKPLVQHEGTPVGTFLVHGPCMKSGTFKVTKIEAIDHGNDAGGQPVATVRARIRFVPEEWIADTKNMPAWSAYWKNISETENAQWLYTLLKSGNDFYSHGPGHKLQ